MYMVYIYIYIKRKGFTSRGKASSLVLQSVQKNLDVSFYDSRGGSLELET